MPYQAPGDDVWRIPNPDSSKHYRWISDDPKRLSEWTRSSGGHPGYQLVDATEAEALGFPSSYINTVTNRVRHGFNVLASIPIEEHHRRQRERYDDQMDKIGATKDAFLAAVDSMPGVKALDRSPEEHFDRKEFATRPSQHKVSLNTPRSSGRPASRVPTDDQL